MKSVGPGRGIECVLFDYGGTLDADGRPWKTRFAALCTTGGMRFPERVFDRAFYRADDALVGRVPETLSLARTAQRLSRGLFRALGLTGSGDADRVAARFVRDSCAQAARNAGLLERLRKRFRLGVVSNFYGNLATVCADVGIGQYFDVVVDSVLAGCEKPDARIFNIALEGLGVPPERAMFVGDSLRRDMQGARALGMPHAWLRGAAAGDPPCCAGDPVLLELNELLDVLA